MNRLTDEQVVEIRRAYEEGLELQHDLARRYGVSQAMISYIVHRKRRTGLRYELLASRLPRKERAYGT